MTTLIIRQGGGAMGIVDQTSRRAPGSAPRRKMTGHNRSCFTSPAGWPRPGGAALQPLWDERQFHSLLDSELAGILLVDPQG